MPYETTTVSPVTPHTCRLRMGFTVRDILNPELVDNDNVLSEINLKTVMSSNSSEVRSREILNNASREIAIKPPNMDLCTESFSPGKSFEDDMYMEVPNMERRAMSVPKIALDSTGHSESLVSNMTRLNQESRQWSNSSLGTFQYENPRIGTATMAIPTLQDRPALIPLSQHLQIKNKHTSQKIQSHSVPQYHVHDILDSNRSLPKRLDEKKMRKPKRHNGVLRKGDEPRQHIQRTTPNHNHHEMPELLFITPTIRREMTLTHNPSIAGQYSHGYVAPSFHIGSYQQKASRAEEDYHVIPHVIPNQIPYCYGPNIAHCQPCHMTTGAVSGYDAVPRDVISCTLAHAHDSTDSTKRCGTGGHSGSELDVSYDDESPNIGPGASYESTYCDRSCRYNSMSGTSSGKLTLSAINVVHVPKGLPLILCSAL